MIQRTLVLIKPDALKRNLIGEIIKRYETKGLKVSALKMLDAKGEIVEKHYPVNPQYLRIIGEKSVQAGEKVSNSLQQGRQVVKWLREFIASGPVVAMILQGEDAVSKVRKITGATDPSQAQKGTIRGDLGQDCILKANSEHRPVYNLVHASDSKEEAEKEIKLWFGHV